MNTLRDIFPGMGTRPRVLVTGGAGFLGHHLVARLLDDGADVRVLDDLSTGSRSRLHALPDECFFQGSILDMSAVERAANEADLVLHLAAIVGMRRVYVDPSHTFRVSDTGTHNVLAATGSAPAIVVSSSAVYGLEPTDVAHETHVASMESALGYDGGTPGYACGKLAAEKHAFAVMDTGRPVLLLRPFNVVGPRQRSSLGMVLPTFVERALAGEPLLVHDDGMQSRSFGDVSTFVDCVLRLMGNTEAWKPSSNPINIGTAETTSIAALAAMVLEETGSSSVVQHVPFDKVFPGKRDVRHRRPNTERLEGLVGEVKWKSLRSVVRDYINAR